MGADVITLHLVFYACKSVLEQLEFQQGDTFRADLLILSVSLLVNTGLNNVCLHVYVGMHIVSLQVNIEQIIVCLNVNIVCLQVTIVYLHVNI